MKLREIFFCCHAEGSCTVKVFGADAVVHFADFIAALAFVKELPGIVGAKLTVLDRSGKVTCQSWL